MPIDPFAIKATAKDQSDLRELSIRNDMVTLENARKSGKPVDPSFFGRSRDIVRSGSTTGQTIANEAQSRLLAQDKSGKASPGSFKKGGLVKKTGMAMVHKGEFVIPRNAMKKGKPKLGLSDMRKIDRAANRKLDDDSDD